MEKYMQELSQMSLYQLRQKEHCLNVLGRKLMQVPDPSKKMIGQQYIEASEILQRIVSMQGQPVKVPRYILKRIQKGLQPLGVKVNNGYLYQDQVKGEQLYLFVKKKRKQTVTEKEIALQLSKILKKRMRPFAQMPQKRIEDSKMIGFQEECKFHVLTGVVTKSFLKDEENGDNFSIGAVDSVRFVSAISDGMGTGNQANQDSKQMIEVLEELLEIGLNEELAIGFLQVLFQAWPSQERFVTLDYLQMNLEAGIGSFLKLGACPSFLLRKGEVMLIGEAGMPIGTGKKALPMVRKKLECDDLILQMSDGIIDGLGEYAIDIIVEGMKKIKVQRPQKYVECLIEYFQGRDEFKERDDWTMIALRIMDKY